MSETESIKDVLNDRKPPCAITFTAEDQVFKGTSMHFSDRGLLVKCKNPAPLNTKGKVGLLFPGLKHPIEVSGEVVWTNLYGSGDSFSPKGMGIKFINIDRDIERLLTDLAGQYETLNCIYSCYFT